MTGNRKKWLALGLAAVMAVSAALTGCGSDNAASGTGSSDAAETTTTNETTEAADTETSAVPDATGETDAAETAAANVEEADADTTFGLLLLGDVGSQYYDNYSKNPSSMYWLSKGWDADGDGNAKKISLEYLMPPADGASDYVNTLMATGEYPEILALSLVSDTPLSLYEEGVLLDLTDYIDQYMPNLKQWLADHPTYVPQMTAEIDGEQRYLYLPIVADSAEDPWGCYNYRRDWIVKYGKDEDGNAFTGSYDDEGIWHDDIVFPSGNTDPMFISDWEWMLDIFKTAIDTEQIPDGYAYQITQSGFVGTGDFASGFGAMLGFSGYYFDEDGTVKYGFTEDNARAYYEAMHAWYENGWLNPYFNEFPADQLWFNLDTESVYNGKVGAWYGLVSQWGPSLDAHDGGYTDGICVYAAPQPINDVYGDESCQGIEPRMFYETSMGAIGSGITNKAEGKDLATLFTALDYLYSPEGGRLRYMGLSDQQMEEAKGIDPEITALYDEYDMECAYWIEEQDGSEVYLRNNAILKYEDSLKVALNLVRVGVGTSHFAGIDFGYDENYAHNMELARMYDASATLGLLTSKLTPDQNTEYSMNNTNASTYLAQTVPEFVFGTMDVTDDAVWDTYCKTLESYGVSDNLEWLNAAAGK